MTRERKLADSWKVLRVHADSLRSGPPTPNESGLVVSSNGIVSSKHLLTSHLAGCMKGITTKLVDVPWMVMPCKHVYIQWSLRGLKALSINEHRSYNHRRMLQRQSATPASGARMPRSRCRLWTTHPLPATWRWHWPLGAACWRTRRRRCSAGLWLWSASQPASHLSSAPSKPRPSRCCELLVVPSCKAQRSFAQHQCRHTAGNSVQVHR